ncbi:MAG TPA: hypothetical protein VGB54_09265 [Allosphingosinicella sp.]|jgi:peptidoglycan/LPS O-acetylase OafA/YrhL
MRLFAILFSLLALGLFGLSTWAYFNESGLFGLPHPRGVPVAATLSTLAAVLAGAFFRKSRGPAERNVPFANLSARERAISGGVFVILATGFAALISVSGLIGGERLPAPAVIVIVALSLPVAWLTAKFVAKHGDEIGEARFDTRNPEEEQP